MPAVCAVGEPVLPLPVPGAAVSPGISTCNCDAEPALTVTAALFDDIVAPPSELASTVETASVKVILMVPTPPLKATDVAADGEKVPATGPVMVIFVLLLILVSTVVPPADT